MQNSPQNPELIDWTEQAPPGSRFGFFPGFPLGILAGAALLGGGFGCGPSHFHHHWRDYYTCSPKYVCRPVPYYP